MQGSWRVPKLRHAILIAIAVCFAFAIIPGIASAEPGGSTISGTVTLDGVPVDGATCWLWDDTLNDYVGPVVADVNGDYAFTGLAAGDYYVEFWDASDSNWLGDSDWIYADGISTYTVDGTFFTEVPGVPVISGNITDEVSGEPIFDAWADLTIYDPVFEAWDYIDTTWTDELGDWSFTDASVVAGVDYVIVSGAAGHYDEVYDNVQNPADATLVNWNGTDAVTGIDAALAAYPVVATGTIADSDTEAPIADATVYLWLYDTIDDVWYIFDGVSTAADGTYSLTSEVFAGTDYKVSASKPMVYAEGFSDPFTWAGETQEINLALQPLSKSVAQVAGSTRFSGSVAIAGEVFDPAADGSWPGVTDVVLACGDDRAAADPLGAAGLSWAYNAPLFLTSSGSVDSSVKEAIKQIATANGDVTIHIVGGLVSVPDARYNEIVSFVGSAGTLTKDRLLVGGSRFDMSAEIAQRMADEMGDAPSTVLIANGQDSTKFFDALALSPIAAGTGAPILLVDSTGIPTATQAKINEFKADGGATQIIVGGGAKTVPESTVTKLGATRWAGSTRYSTALVIADNAVDEGWLNYEPTGVAAKLPDALTGGSVMGLQGGVLVLTDGTTLTPETGNWFSAHKAEIVNVYCFGGDKSLTPAVRTAIYNKIK